MKQPAKPKKPPTDWEQVFYEQCKAIGLPEPIREFLGIPGRKFRFDFLFPLMWNKHLVVEVEGGTWGSGSRHTSGVGFDKDCEKYNLATRKGYEVYRFTSKRIGSGEAVNFIREVIVEREHGVRDYPVWTKEAYPIKG